MSQRQYQSCKIYFSHQSMTKRMPEQGANIVRTLQECFNTHISDLFGYYRKKITFTNKSVRKIILLQHAALRKLVNII